jgi:hypothetical protein
MTQKNVRLQQFLGDPTLPGIHNFVSGCGFCQLCKVLLLDRITDYDSHASEWYQLNRCARTCAALALSVR